MPAGMPNIVFVLVDNTGYGDWSVYGGTTATPRIDALAQQGVRFTNYTVENQCTPTRSAILTGRLPVRTGCNAVPLPGQGAYGLAPFEYTLASLLSDAGYATGAFGKWHLGEVPGRLPADKGFDEWWGHKNSTDEAGYSSYAMYRALEVMQGLEPPKIWQARKGKAPQPVRDLDMTVRPLLDELITEQAADFITRQAADGKPFFAYVALTHMHPPEAAHPDFAQTSPARGGLYADLVAEMDYRVGQLLDAVSHAGVDKDTIFVLSSDNATGGVTAVIGGSNGPFRGDFFTPPFEGSMRVPAIIRWPAGIPAGVVTDEIFTAEDWYTTLAGLAGQAGRVPDDRPIDGIDASAFLQGRTGSSGRDHVLFFGADGGLMSVKWRWIKMIMRYCEGADQPIVQSLFPQFFDLSSDPGEKDNLFTSKLDMGWMTLPVFQAIGAYEQSLARYPNIPTGADFTGYQQQAGKQAGKPDGSRSRAAATRAPRRASPAKATTGQARQSARRARPAAARRRTG